MNPNENVKDETEIDIRDVGNYLFGKIWIIALATVCLALFAFLFTSLFVTPTYSSTAKRIVVGSSIQNSASAQIQTGTSIAKESEEIVKSVKFCSEVAAILNDTDPSTAPLVPDTDKSFREYYGKDITYSEILSAVSVDIKEEDSFIVSFTAITVDPRVSAVIANTISDHYAAFLKTLEFEDDDYGYVSSLKFSTEIIEYANVSSTPTSSNMIRNTLIAAAVGLVLSCAVLIVIFIFDDKIKTPDDIQNRLKLNVLGVIPEIENDL
ncbi:MAG: hypothetical protein J6B60_01590 [Clostridia bacterium]|nr:hypothetical protein [Clostridia bacterium]